MRRQANRRKYKTKKRKLVIFTICITLIVSTLFVGYTAPNIYSNFLCNTYLNNAGKTIPNHSRSHKLSNDEYPAELFEMYKNNPEAEDFVLNYPDKKDNYEEYIDISDCLNSDSVPLFLQWDERWGYYPYSDDMIGVSGCGPTCLSMV